MNSANLARLRAQALALWKLPVVNITARLLVLAVIVWWIAGRLDLRRAAEILRTPDRAALAGMIACAILFGTLGGVKAWTLLRPLAPISLKRSVMYFFVATSIGTFTPGSLGDFSFAAFMKREGLPVQEGLAVVLVDRLISVSLYIVVFVPLTFMLVMAETAGWWFALLYVLGVLALFGLNTSARVRRFVRVDLIERFAPRSRAFFQTSSRLMRVYPHALAANIGLGVVRCIVGGIVVWFALAAVGTQAPWFPVVAVANTLTVISLLPLTFGGLGVYESSGVLLFEAMGLSAPHVLAALLLQRAYIVVSSQLILLVAAVLYFWRRYVRAPRGAQTA